MNVDELYQTFMKTSGLNKMRQEIKFRFYPTELDSFLLFLHKNRLFQTYQPRNVSSIYYDSFDYSAAQSNLSGDLTRRSFD